MNDKRKHKRHQTRDLLTVVDRETAQPIADLANLSSDGAMFISPQPVEIGHLFKCRLELLQPISDRNEIEFDAVCRWSRSNSVQNCHESGFRLINVSDTDKEIISLLILRCVIDEWSYPDAESAQQAQESVGH
jgi:hypothetical protein